MNHVVHAGMATMLSRKFTAKWAIKSILHQVDVLHLYLDGFHEVPDFAKHRKIRIVHSADEPGLKANGKLLGMVQCPSNAFYLTVDDDYWYPSNFVNRLITNYHELNQKAVFGVHGSIFLQPFTTFLKDRRVFTAWKPLRERTPVDLVATCGTLHNVKDLCFDVRDWRISNQVDLHFAEEMHRAGVEGHLVSRGWFWLVPIGQNQVDSIFRSLKEDDSRQTEMARRLFFP